MSGSDLCHFHVETFNWWCSWQTSFFLLQWSWKHEASVILGPSETKLSRDPCWPMLDMLPEWEITLDGVIEIWGSLHYHMLIHNIAHLDCYKKNTWNIFIWLFYQVLLLELRYTISSHWWICKKLVTLSIGYTTNLYI